jgi:hypothetical protein
MAPRDDLEMTRLPNDGVLASAEEHKGFFFPVRSVHPLGGKDVLVELELVAVAGARGPRAASPFRCHRDQDRRVGHARVPRHRSPAARRRPRRSCRDSRR